MNQTDPAQIPPQAPSTTATGWRQFYQYWLPVVCWMGLIFYLSSSSKAGSPLFDMGIHDFFVKKTAHVAEYALLYLLLFRAFHSGISGPNARSKAFLCSAIIAILYAASDEYHQTFVPLREGRLRDVLIDTFGIFLMYLFLRRNASKTQK
ncbi:MAG: VanZ like family protein [Syntrophorhabdus sp. PtaU1.Bin153]|nr:MAG: VanZ like family protein [Syntrophorhabdus sp. PtaU1.Bin153]